MPGPYSIEQRAAMAEAIDTALGTAAARSDTTTGDLLLDWMTAVATIIEKQTTEISALTTEVNTLQQQVSTALAAT